VEGFLMRDCIKIACVIIGTVIGAGFASGQEIVQFFTIFTERSLWGVIISGLLFCVISICVLDYVYIKKIQNYKELLEDIRYKPLTAGIRYLSLIFLAATFIIMTAGTGAYFYEYYKVPYVVGSGIMAILCMVVFMFNLFFPENYYCSVHSFLHIIFYTLL
jgi:uncharacterized membrane protein YkvI